LISTGFALLLVIVGAYVFTSKSSEYAYRIWNWSWSLNDRYQQVSN
jgi:hypothetical protein